LEKLKESPDFPKFPQIKPKEKAFPEDGFSPVAFQPDFGGPRAEMVRHTSWWAPSVILTTSKPYDRKDLLKRFLLPQGDERHRGDRPAVLCLSERSFMLGHAEALMQYADHPARAVSPKGKGGMDGMGGMGGGGFGKGGGKGGFAQP